jgi:16S rRNA (cytosine1402-N4)-methyltransferase
MSSDAQHVPVMLEEVCSFIQPEAGGAYIDATLGLGGHAEAILERSAPDGKLFGIDRDEKALALARKRLKRFGDRVQFAHCNFDDIAEAVREHGFKKADGILADLGVSSMQLDLSERGFSFMREGPLDMRMDESRGESAADLIARIDESELADVIYNFGEERFSRRIARGIVEARKKNSIETTSELARIVEKSVPGRRGRIHPATRTFQALRIAVNDELGQLKRFLEQSIELLGEGGRLVIISYHSLEDRMVKNAFRDAARVVGRIITKKVVVPSRDEEMKNPRARSAKLRVFEKSGLSF